MRAVVSLIAAMVALHAASNPQAEAAAKAAHAWREAHERAIAQEYMTLLAIPNLASDASNIRKNADTIQKMLARRGVASRLLEVEGAPPAVYGEVRTPGARRTIVFYAHYDGQPVDAKEWATPPWQPVLRDKSLERDGRTIPLPDDGSKFDPEWRIYARSASDDKAPIQAMLTALDALKAAGIRLQSNIRFIFEGEEEAGSPHLGDIIAAHKDLLSGDVWLMCDGPNNQTGRQQIVFGARGDETLDVTVYGPARELHSGHYGNWAPNPAEMLARLLASMKADDGRVLVEHFYDGIEPLSETEKRALAEAPQVDADLKRQFWLGRTDGGGKPLLELLNFPALNVRGMGSSRTGAQASNVIPATATASLDIRLVKGIDHRVEVERVIEHIRKQGYFVTDHDPDARTLTSHSKVAKVVRHDSGYNASRTSMDLPISRAVIEAAESAISAPVIKLPTEGGSVPLVTIEGILNVPTISVPMVNYDNNQHSYNENLRIQNLWDGIELMAALLGM